MKETPLSHLQEAIDRLPDDMKEDISDGYHTFKELYEHRIALFITLCNTLTPAYHSHGKSVWKSKLHSDGTMWEGWFIAGIGLDKGKTLTYHIPLDKWDSLYSIEIDKAPEWDGHTSSDVVGLLYSI